MSNNTDRNYIEEFRLKLKEAGVETSKRIELMIWFGDVISERYDAGSKMASAIWNEKLRSEPSTDTCRE